MRGLRTLACLVAVSTVAPVALAQTEGPPPGAPPPATAAPPPPAMAPATVEAPEEMRFRWGITGFGGKYFVAGTGGGIGGFGARFGVQMNRMIGFYGSPFVLIGGGASVSAGQQGGSTSVSLVALGGLGALVDFTFNDLIFVAIGPEFFRGAAAQAATQASSSGGAGASASAEAGTFFGVEARAGLALGSMKPNKRKAFTIGIDLHTIFTSKPMIVPMLALGFDAF